MTTIGVVIPTIPPRTKKLLLALKSVAEQERLPDEIIVPVDREGVGACENRNIGARAITSEWTAFLDDDDIFFPEHLRVLEETQQETGADLVYPWFDGKHAHGLLKTTVDGKAVDVQGVEFGPEQAEHLRTKSNFIPITVLVRTELLREVGFFRPFDHASPDNPCEDWATWVRLLDVGAKIVHLPEYTWEWHVDGLNTSGRMWTACERV